MALLSQQQRCCNFYKINKNASSIGLAVLLRETKMLSEIKENQGNPCHWAHLILQSSTMSTHALAFKVLRLRPSDLADSDQSKSHFDKVVPSATAPFRDHPLERSDTNEHADQLNDQEKPQLGVGSAQNFGTVYLGQTLTVAIALCNISANTTVHNVGIRVRRQ
jgi:hypothetical protein